MERQNTILTIESRRTAEFLGKGQKLTLAENTELWRESKAELKFNGPIYFFHNPGCFVKSNNGLLVMQNIIYRQLSAFAIFQPLLGRLITADIKRPGDFLSC
jgi:hypothetical protein